MKCLISGVAGFIGSHLADKLIEEGYEVVGIDNFMTGDIKNLNEKVYFYENDIRVLRQIKVVFSVEKPDWVFHLAANCRTGLSIEDPVMDMENNIQGTLNMLLAARDAKVKRFVYASSCILYAPNTPYFVSKQAGEAYASVFNKCYGMSTISLRYSNVYGSLRQSEKGTHINAIASLRKSKRETGRIWITGDGKQTRDWSHVTDVVRANILAAQSNATGVYDVSTGVQTSMNDVAKYFKCPIDFVPERVGDVKHLSVTQDPKPAERDFGYKYKIPFNHDSLKVYL